MTPVFLLAALMWAGAPLQAQVPAEPLRLWHAYRGGEEKALEAAVALFKAKTGVPVELLSVSYDIFAHKLISAIPHDQGPDVFIFAHQRLASFEKLGLIGPTPGPYDGYLPKAVEALSLEGKTYGYPLSLKCLALYWNKDIIASAPRTTDELEAALSRATDSAAGRFGLAYEATDFYYHAAILFGFGGRLFDGSGRAAFDTPEMAKSLAFVRSLQDRGFMPHETSGNLVKSLFNSGSAAMAISGPWFAGEIRPSLRYEVSPLPIVSDTQMPMRPLLEIEAAFVSARARHPRAAELARFLSMGEASLARVKIGRQIPADRGAYEAPAVKADAFIAAFSRAAVNGMPMPGGLEMSRIFEPMKLALRAVMQGNTAPAAGGALADRRYRALYRSAPAPASPWPYAVALLSALAAAAIWAARARCPKGLSRPFGPGWERGPQTLRALGYAAPAAAGILVLVAIPLLYGIGLSLFHHEGGHYTFVGLGNYKDILSSADYRITEPMSFYFTLAITVLWTALNIAAHVGIGVALALLLRSPLLRLKGLYRVILILPWAVPNYITALLWKGMFHRQFGAVNGLLAWLGLEPVSWFSRFSTAFAANLVTNTWLGFPFMMVVALGCLQSIPDELYEAAEVDGAGAWEKFRRITLPLLRPAMAPSVMLGVVWTFNMFNVIYLVSSGEPGGATDILVSDAYQWAFQRNEQYGFAAAYSTLIFLLLWGYSIVSRRVSGQEAAA